LHEQVPEGTTEVEGLEDAVGVAVKVEGILKSVLGYW
jgi:hypothetical protein